MMAEVGSGESFYIHFYSEVGWKAGVVRKTKGRREVRNTHLEEWLRPSKC